MSVSDTEPNTMITALPPKMMKLYCVSDTEPNTMITALREKVMLLLEEYGITEYHSGLPPTDENALVIELSSSKFSRLCILIGMKRIDKPKRLLFRHCFDVANPDTWLSNNEIGHNFQEKTFIGFILSVMEFQPPVKDATVV
jgi:hypothetical protein